jgi:hypothetical protein
MGQINVSSMKGMGGVGRGREEGVEAEGEDDMEKGSKYQLDIRQRKKRGT